MQVGDILCFQVAVNRRNSVVIVLSPLCYTLRRNGSI